MRLPCLLHVLNLFKIIIIIIILFYFVFSSDFFEQLFNFPARLQKHKFIIFISQFTPSCCT